MIEVFCDGSVSSSLLTGVYNSSSGDVFVGRAVVVVPAADIGLVTQTREGMLTERGTPASENAEVFAIDAALGLCRRHALGECVVFSDCQGAVARFPGAPVEWRPRQEMRLPNDFFDKILGRASYLRRTEGRVARRFPPQPHQVEIVELFNAELHEFKLSTSPLWERVCRDARRHPASLGVDSTGS